MQSFAYKVKSELCRGGVQRLCCARAEAYGVLLYCNTFSAKEIRIITENSEFAARLPKLFNRAFGLRFDRVPEEDTGRGKLIFQITEKDKLDKIINLFGYDPKQTVLHDISLFAKPGQKIAFVGSTGAGKTTITNLINRFYEIQSGTITYDGIDVKEIRK